MSKKIPFSLILIILTFSILTSGCSKEKTTEPSFQDSSSNSLRVAISTDPLVFDPRLARDSLTANFMHMLFEGLMRIGIDGKAEPGLAESVTISPDKKTYQFNLRQSFWTDGHALTAEDFVETWKSILSPHFPAPNAYQLYVIEGAKTAKEGKLPLSAVAISAPNPLTLVVTLENPTPYFLEMTACHFFYPIPRELRQETDGNKTTSSKQIISNGPFKLAHWKQRDEIYVVKNPFYWDAEAVKLPGIKLQIVDENTALQLFKAGELDWVGSPMSTLPQDVMATLKTLDLLKVAPAAATHWFRFNTQKTPFDDVKMRKAFGLALNRLEIVEHITQGNQQPALGIVPVSFGLGTQQSYQDNDVSAGQKLFMMGLISLKDEQKTLPSISLCYSSNDRNHKIAQAVQQQWNKAFGINVILEACESQILFDKLNTGSYQMSLGSWYADIRDPINFLEIFKSKETPTNNTFWENHVYTDLLNQSSLDNSEETRANILMQAESILMEEMPVASLFFGAFNYLKNDKIQGVYFSELGYLDFKYASFK